MTNQPLPAASFSAGNRLQSLDFFRGFTMTMLILGETNIFYWLKSSASSTLVEKIAGQFEHSAWHGIRFWDLLLPSFMFLAGTSMAISLYSQRQKSETTERSIRVKIARRCFWLFFWGMLVYSVRDHHINYQFSNVLVELSFASLITFLVSKKNVYTQGLVTAICLLLPEFLYRYSQVPGFDQPFTDLHNFGNYVDLIVLRRLNPGYSPTLDFIPCTAYTLWGLMAGNLLLSAKTASLKIRTLLFCGLGGIVLGLCLDLFHITPILKWLESSSFVLVTGGTSAVVLGSLYYWIDVRRHVKYLSFFTIVGMNPIFIYLFMIFISPHLFDAYLDPIVTGLSAFAGIGRAPSLAFAALLLFILEWQLCYYLFRKKIFFRL